MGFKLDLPIEVERHAGELSAATSVTVQLVYRGAKWRAQCQDPPVTTLMCDSLEEALIAAVKAMKQDWAAQATI